MPGLSRLNFGEDRLDAEFPGDQVRGALIVARQHRHLDA